MQGPKKIADAGKEAGKKVLATDTAQGVVEAVVDKLEEIAVEKADDVAATVKDRAATPNTILPNTQATFRSFVVTCGFLNFASYKNIAGVAVAALTGDPKFPNNPDETGYLSSFDTRTIYPTDALENYGGWITASVTFLSCSWTRRTERARCW